MLKSFGAGIKFFNLRKGLLGLAFILICSLIVFRLRGTVDISYVCFQGRCLEVEVADTPQERSTGLAGRRSLPDGKGMLFIFPKEDFWRFWMRHTYIALDLIWLDNQRCVVSFKKNAQPEKDGVFESFSAKEPARYVLEAKAGFIVDNKINIGDQATFSRFFIRRRI